MSVKLLKVTLDVQVDTAKLRPTWNFSLDLNAEVFDYALNGEGQAQPYRVTGCKVEEIS